MQTTIVKKCNQCSKLKPLEDYHKDNVLKSGYRGTCKGCIKASYSTEEARAMRNAVNRRLLQANPSRRKSYKEKYYRKNKDKVKAQRALVYAVKSGKIIKPKKCGRCQETNLILHGHHNDYSKPYDVKWVCPLCHKAIHAQAAIDTINKHKETGSDR